MYNQGLVITFEATSLEELKHKVTYWAKQLGVDTDQLDLPLEAPKKPRAKKTQAPTDVASTPVSVAIAVTPEPLFTAATTKEEVKKILQFLAGKLGIESASTLIKKYGYERVSAISEQDFGKIHAEAQKLISDNEMDQESEYAVPV